MHSRPTHAAVASTRGPAGRGTPASPRSSGARQGSVHFVPQPNKSTSRIKQQHKPWPVSCADRALARSNGWAGHHLPVYAAVAERRAGRRTTLVAAQRSRRIARGDERGPRERAPLVVEGRSVVVVQVEPTGRLAVVPDLEIAEFTWRGDLSAAVGQ